MCIESMHKNGYDTVNVRLNTLAEYSPLGLGWESAIPVGRLGYYGLWEVQPWRATEQVLGYPPIDYSKHDFIKEIVPCLIQFHRGKIVVFDEVDVVDANTQMFMKAFAIEYTQNEIHTHLRQWEKDSW